MFLIFFACAVRPAVGLVIKYLPYVTSNGTVCSAGGCRSFVHVVVSASGVGAEGLTGGARWGSSRSYDFVDDNLRSESHAVSGDCSNSSDVETCIFYNTTASMYSWGWEAYNSSHMEVCAELWFRGGATLELPCFSLAPTATASECPATWTTSFNSFSSAVTSTSIDTRAHLVFSVSPPLDVLNRVWGSLEYSWDRGASWSSNGTRVFFETHISADADGRWSQAWQADFQAEGEARSSVFCYRISLDDDRTRTTTSLASCLPVATSLVPFHWPAGYCPDCISTVT